jgi:hypothetical protein
MNHYSLNLNSRYVVKRNDVRISLQQSKHIRYDADSDFDFDSALRDEDFNWRRKANQSFMGRFS